MCVGNYWHCLYSGGNIGEQDGEFMQVGEAQVGEAQVGAHGGAEGSGAVVLSYAASVHVLWCPVSVHLAAPATCLSPAIPAQPDIGTATTRVHTSLPRARLSPRNHWARPRYRMHERASEVRESSRCGTG